MLAHFGISSDERHVRAELVRVAVEQHEIEAPGEHAPVPRPHEQDALGLHPAHLVAG